MFTSGGRALRRSHRLIAFALRKGHDHHGPNMPPFARLAPPAGSVLSFSSDYLR